jgi:4-aminobutyrate aminotransferase/(S)-3-amino-2-methylpropionate transaminase
MVKSPDRGQTGGSEEVRNESLLALRHEYVAQGVATQHPIFVARAQAACLWDVDGNEYIDFTSGLSVLNVGHNHQLVTQAVNAQLERLSHTCFQVAMYEPYVRLAERLCRLAPGPAPKKALFLSTGAEAIENAVKIARAYTGRPGIITFAHAFHGRTLLGMTLTGKASPYKQRFGPFAPEIYQAPYPYEYRGWSTERALAGLVEVFDTQIAPDRVAAVVIEPIVGEGGFIPAPPGYLRELRRLTAEHGILLVADEIQCGYGRAGAMFAIEHAGVVPDLITVAKSMAGGLPLSGVIGRADVMDAPAPGGLGGTFAGNPLACAAALAVLDIFEAEDLIERARHIESILRPRFHAWMARYPLIGDVRIVGAMAALEFVTAEGDGLEPAAAVADAIIDEARGRGLLLLKAGLANNVIRTLMPLTVGDDVLEAGLSVLEASIAAVTRQQEEMQPIPRDDAVPVR